LKQLCIILIKNYIIYKKYLIKSYISDKKEYEVHLKWTQIFTKGLEYGLGKMRGSNFFQLT